MKRRHFIGAAGAAVAAVVSGAPAAARAKPTPGFRPCTFDGLPREIAGRSLDALRDDCHKRLFGRYLPFWHQGGFDADLGGVICELNDDGSVFRDEKFIWYQGRAVWIYSFLYEHVGKQERFLEIARNTKQFMVRHMHAGGGRWHEKVRRDGTLLEGPGKNVYGSLFAAAGLAEFYGFGLHGGLRYDSCQRPATAPGV